MRHLIRILSCLAIFMACAFTLFGYPAGALLAAPPVVLDTQQIAFLRSLKEEYVAIDTWVNEAEDLSAFAADGQTLVFPEAGAFPTVYKNRTTDVDSVEPTETTNEVSLDVYDTQNYKVRNINLYALPFNKIQYYTKKSSDGIVKQEVEDTAHEFCPDASGYKKIVVPSTGPARNGYKMLTLDDIVTLVRALDNAQFPESGRVLVLPADMWWDLVVNNKVLQGQLSYQANNGVIEPLMVSYYGIKIYKSVQQLGVGYDVANSVKATQGTVITGNVVPAGFLFIGSQTFRASGQFLMFSVPLSQNTSGRAYEFGFQHRFKTGHQMSGKRYTAMVYLAKA